MDLMPLYQAVAGGELQQTRLAGRLAIKIPHEFVRSGLLIHVGAAEDVAVARPVLQRDAPLPAGTTGD